MAIQREPHVEQDGGGNANILIARKNIERESEDGDCDHRGADFEQHVKIALEQGVVDQKFRDVRLNEAERGGNHARK